MAQGINGIPIEYEPLRKNRFILEFPTELGIESFKVQSIKKPQLEVNMVEVHWLNTVNFVAGKGKWQPMDVTLIDTVGPSTGAQVMDWARLEFESLTGRMGYKAGYAKSLILKELDPTNVEVSKWTLEECILSNIDFGEGSYDDDGLAIITMTIQPFMCIKNF